MNDGLARRAGLLLVGVASALASLGCMDAVPVGGPLATGQKGVTSIAVDDFFVYMAIADGSIKKVSLDGGPVITVTSGPAAPSNIVVDTDHVYWTTPGAIAKAPKAGGPTVTLVEGEGDIGGITLDDANVYFTATATNEVKSVSKTGQAGLTLASQQTNPRPIASLASGVYWGTATADASTGAVMMLDTTKAAPPLSLIHEQTPTALAVSSTHVYWRNSGDGSVMWADLGGGEPRTVTTGQTVFGQIAGDEDTVYWTGTDGTLSMAPLAGGAAEVLSSGPGTSTVSLALDVTSVYWANSVDGAVMTRPKF